MSLPTTDRSAFLAQYRAVRDRDGYRVGSPGYYRALPATLPTDPHHLIWNVRQQSFERFRAMVRARFRHAQPTLLDLGAGNGWLSYRMTAEGCRSVAVDIFDDDLDGLRAAEHFDVAFPRVQADFDALPFAPRQFDVIVFNGSLHYAPDVRATLTRVAPLLAPGGVIAVIDSPMFECQVAGTAMRERTRVRFQREYGLVEPLLPGEGFLLFDALRDTAGALGFDTHFFESRGGTRWSLGRWAGRLRHRVRPPRFGVWWAA